MSDGLVPSVGSPPGQPTPVGVQPGTTPGIVLGRYVIVFGPAGGIFLYSGQPAFGNPPIAWGTLATTDPFKNPIQPGIFLAELASSGNALGGLLWNTVIGSEPLLALFPDSTLGFTGNSPFALGRVFNRGLASESVSLALGGGGASGISSPVMLELFGQSKDGTTVLPHAEFYFPLFVEGIDTNVYSAGHLTLPATATPEIINQTTAETITGCTADLAAKTYKIEAEIQFTASLSAGNPSFQIGVSAATSAIWGNGFIWQTSGAGAGVNRFTADTSRLVFQGPGMVAGAVYIARIKGLIICTGAGAISLQAFTSAAADTFVINNAVLELSPSY